MDDRTLRRTAKALLRATDFNFIISVGKKNRISEFSISIDPGEITHIIGLDHTPYIKSLTSHKNRLKRQVIKEISNGTVNLSNFKKEDMDILNSPIERTYNPDNGQCYTLVDRIEKLKNINVFLSRAYKGELYDWEKKLFSIKTPNGQKRFVDIQADYLLAIPSNIKNEKIYFFMYVDKNNTSSIKKLNVMSAFQDGVDLTQSQRVLGKILKEDKINNKTHKLRKLFDITAKHAPTSAPNIMQITYNNGDIRDLPNPDGTAKAIPKQQTDENFNLHFLGKIKQFFTEKIHQAFDNIKLRSELSEMGKQMLKREDQLSDALNEIEDNKQLLAEKDNLISEKDKQIEDLTAENAGLKKENAQLEETVAKLSEKIEAFEKQKQPVLTATKSAGSFLNGISKIERNINSKNSAKPQQPNAPNINPKNKPKH